MVSEHANRKTARDETRFNNHTSMKCGLHQPMGAAMSETLFCATLFVVALILSFVI
jgi:hypothetical protein